MPSNDIAPDSIDKELLRKLVSGAQKTFENAKLLFQEASLLRGAGFLSRALFLHQISLEDCAKVEILGASATSLLMGHACDLAKVRTVLASHARKNRTNAYFLDLSEEEEAASTSGDLECARNAFSQMQKEFHLKANTAKNASLYVDLNDAGFVAPNESITSEMVAEIAALNEKYLGLSSPKIAMLHRWGAAPVQVSKQVRQFERRIHELRSERPDDPITAMSLLLREMLQTQITKDE